MLLIVNIFLVSFCVSYAHMNEQEFDIWNNKKKELSKSEDVLDVFPKEGEVWMVVMGKNIGFEQNGSGENFVRPGLVVKRFNNHMFWVVPLSTKQKEFDFYYNFTDPDELKVSAILAQMKLVSVKRFIRDMYSMEERLFSDILKKLKNMITS